MISRRVRHLSQVRTRGVNFSYLPAKISPSYSDLTKVPKVTKNVGKMED